MAVNPITSDNLTLDFKSLMKVPVGDRARAAAYDQAFLQSILSALTPIQIAQAFPDYFRRQLPDVSNFITSNIVARNGGRFDQTGGGSGGSAYPYFDKETKPSGSARPRGAPEPTIEEMKKKLLEKGIDVQDTYKTLGQGAILEGDKRFDYLKSMSDSDLKAVGMERSQDENGKTIIKLLPTEASALSEEEVMKGASNKIVPGTTGLEGRAALAKQAYDAFVEAGLSDKQARAAVAEVNRENSLNPEYMFGTHTEVAAQAGGRTNYGMFSWGDPSRVKNFKKYMQENGVMDAAGNLLVDNSTYLKQQAKFAVQEMKGYESGRQFLENTDVNSEDATNLLGRYIGWDMAGRRHDASASYDRLREGRKIIDEVNDKMGKILPENPTDAQIEEARRILDQKEREGWSDALIKQQYGKASPTSSEYIQDPNDPRTSTVLGSRVVEEQAGFRKLPIKPELKNSLDYAAEMSGIEVEVFSGGQDHQIHDQMEAAGHESSYRHNIDIPGTPGAADVVLYYRDENGKKIPLSVTNPEHSAKIAAFTENFTRVVPSAGVGSNYMKSGGIIDPTKIHYGGPNKPGDRATTWGNMPDYMREAHQRGVAQRNEDVKNDRDPLREWIIKKEEEERKKQEQTVADSSAVTPSAPAATTETPPVPQTPVEPTQQASAEPPVPQKALGGNLYGVNEDITLVNTETGAPIAQVNNDEKLIKQGSELQVTSESKIKAEELGQQLDTSDDEEPAPQEQQNTNQVRQANRQQPVNNDPDKMWRQMVAERQREDSPSYARAITRSKFGREGFHFNRATPGSTS